MEIQHSTMELNITITGADGQVKARASGRDRVTLVYAAPYVEGDVIRMSGSAPGYVVALLEDSMAETFGYLSGEFCLAVPFGEKRVSYSPKSFTGDIHLLWARQASPREAGAYRNLALNPLDSHDNTGFFPHASANVETRGESVFAARNAIDGCYANSSHGAWPYQSWGINRDPEAELLLDFGREVRVDRLALTLRADFPHDNWWKQCSVQFSDGSQIQAELVKTGEPQQIDLAPRVVRWLKLERLIKDEDDPSPFPALTQIEVWGTDAGRPAD